MTLGEAGTENLKEKIILLAVGKIRLDISSLKQIQKAIKKGTFGTKKGS